MSEAKIDYGNDKRQTVKVVPAKNGRLAILAKVEAEDEKWTQIESIMGGGNAVSYADEMELDDEARTEAVNGESVGEMWEGDDAPDTTEHHP